VKCFLRSTSSGVFWAVFLPVTGIQPLGVVFGVVCIVRSMAFGSTVGYA